MRHLHEWVRQFSNRIRTAYWRALLEMGPKSRVAGRIVIYHCENVRIGSSTVINEGTLINARASITIGSHVHISPYCIINAGGLDYTQTMEKRVHVAKPIIIEDGVWIGSGALINPGVTIGKNSVIAAGAVVTQDIDADSVAVGVPAKVLKKISE